MSDKKKRIWSARPDWMQKKWVSDPLVDAFHEYTDLYPYILNKKGEDPHAEHMKRLLSSDNAHDGWEIIRKMSKSLKRSVVNDEYSVVMMFVHALRGPGTCGGSMADGGTGRMNEKNRKKHYKDIAKAAHTLAELVKLSSLDGAMLMAWCRAVALTKTGSTDLFDFDFGDPGSKADIKLSEFLEYVAARAISMKEFIEPPSYVGDHNLMQEHYFLAALSKMLIGLYGNNKLIQDAVLYFDLAAFDIKYSSLTKQRLQKKYNQMFRN